MERACDCSCVIRRVIGITLVDDAHQHSNKTTMKVLPSPNTAAKLFATGLTVGPVVDSLHNQCLLQYDILAISLKWPDALAADKTYDYFFCSSWTVPPLLGVAYVILGGVLPRIFQAGIDAFVNDGIVSGNDNVPAQRAKSTATSLQSSKSKGSSGSVDNSNDYQTIGVS